MLFPLFYYYYFNIFEPNSLKIELILNQDTKITAKLKKNEKLHIKIIFEIISLNNC